MIGRHVFKKKLSKLGNGHSVYQFTNMTSHGNGITIDKFGMLYVTLFNAASVVKIDPRWISVANRLSQTKCNFVNRLQNINITRDLRNTRKISHFDYFLWATTRYVVCKHRKRSSGRKHRHYCQYTNHTKWRKVVYDKRHFDSRSLRS